MIVKQEAVLIFSKSKAWEMKEKNTSGVSYTAVLYADKAITNCKLDKELYEKVKEYELQKGIAVIEITETSYNGKTGVQYHLREFGIKK